MPYKSNSDLVGSMKGTDKLSENDRTRFRKIFNAVWKQCKKSGGEDCDRKAAGTAWSKIKSKQERWADSYAIVLPDTAFLEERQFRVKDAEGEIDVESLTESIHTLMEWDGENAASILSRARLMAAQYLKEENKDMNMDIADVVIHDLNKSLLLEALLESVAKVPSKEPEPDLKEQVVQLEREYLETKVDLVRYMKKKIEDLR